MAGTTGRTRPRSALVAGGLAAAVALAAGTAWAANQARFTDPEGDAEGGPDIRAVDVQSTDAGGVTVRVEITNRPAADENLIVVAALDTDRNRTTGDRELDGVDFMLMQIGPIGFVGRWDGSDWAFFLPASFRFSYASGPTFTINAADLGGTKAFDLVVVALDDATDTGDVAPDSGVWSYALHRLRLTAAPLRLTPAPLTSSRPFSASMRVTRADTGAALASGTVTCRLTLAGKPLRATGSLRGGVASCSGALPAGSRGKLLGGSITVRFQGAEVTRPVNARVGR